MDTPPELLAAGFGRCPQKAIEIIVRLRRNAAIWRAPRNVAARRNALFAGVISAGAVEEASRVLSAVRGRVRRGVVLRRVFDDL